MRLSWYYLGTEMNNTNAKQRLPFDRFSLYLDLSEKRIFTDVDTSNVAMSYLEEEKLITNLILLETPDSKLFEIKNITIEQALALHQDLTGYKLPIYEKVGMAAGLITFLKSILN